MIDWHSHVLPSMDDGSRDVEESLSLLQMLSEQGVHTVIATPHYYANDESVNDFLDRRKSAFDLLCKQTLHDSQKILLGAEVRYYQGISRMAELKRLCIEGSKLLLLEMPFSKWTEYTVRELVELAGSKDLTVVLAHIERYMKLQLSGTWERLRESGVLMQVNATFFTEFGTRRKALSLLENGGIQFLGSDCHNMTSRPPCIGRAFEIIEKRHGTNFLCQMNEYGYAMLDHK